MSKDPSERDDETDGAESDDLFDADLGSLMAGHLLDDEPPATSGPAPAPEGSTTNGVTATPPVAPGTPAEPPPVARPDANAALVPDDLLAERERTRERLTEEIPPATPSDGPPSDGAPTGRPVGATAEDGESFEAALARAVAEDEAAEAAASNGHHRAEAGVDGTAVDVDGAAGDGLGSDGRSAAGGAPADGATVDGPAAGAAGRAEARNGRDPVIPAAGASAPVRPTVDAGGPPPLADPGPTAPPESTAPPTHQVPSVEATRRDTDEMPVVAPAGDVDEDSLHGRGARRADPATAAAGGDHDEEPVLAEPEAGGKSRVRSAVEWVAAIVIALVTAFLVKTFVLQAFVIPSASMNPTLVDGDRVLVSKLDIGEIERGDVIVFDNPARLPGEPAQLIKRVIGLEGDVLEARDGEVVVNGQVLDEPYLSDEVLTRELEQTTVPDDHVFVMGDNRPNSRDSRFIGAIDVDDIVGEAFLIIWPPNRISTL